MITGGNLGNLPTHQRAGVAKACREGAKHGATPREARSEGSAQFDAMRLVCPVIEISMLRDGLLFCVGDGTSQDKLLVA